MWRIDAHRVMFAPLHTDIDPLVPNEVIELNGHSIRPTTVIVEYGHSSQNPEKGWELTNVAVGGDHGTMRLHDLHRVSSKELPDWLKTLISAAQPHLPMTVPTKLPPEPTPDKDEPGKFVLHVMTHPETETITVSLNNVDPNHLHRIFRDDMAKTVETTMWQVQDVRYQHEGKYTEREE